MHLALQEAVADAVSMGGIPLVIGRGDLTYPGVAGLVRGAGLKGLLGLINVDAHLDVRTDENRINSGTSFYRHPAAPDKPCRETRSSNSPYRTYNSHTIITG